MKHYRGLALCAVLVGVFWVGACSSSDDVDEPVRSASTPPPPTSGVQPWGSDLHGFARVESRCIMDDLAVRLVWSDQNQFAVCRRADGSRYLRSWTRGMPEIRNDKRGADGRWQELPGDFFTDTANSVQFIVRGSDGSDGAKVDIGASAVTIEWPSAPGAKTKHYDTIRTESGWTRLD